MICLISRLRLFIIAISMLSMPIGLQAASVEWGFSSVMSKQSGFEDSDWLFTIGKPYLNVVADVIGSTLVITALPDSNLVNANTFVKGQKGDVVSREYIADKNEYFAWAQYNKLETFSDYSIILDGSESVYLAFAADYASFNSIRYGWMELGLDEDGMLKVLGSAWDIDGDAIRIGSIPEPSSGFMLLFGLVVLGLKRKIK